MPPVDRMVSLTEPTPQVVKRPVSRGARILATLGQRVEPDTPVAALELDTGPLRRLNCARRLSCLPAEIREHLVVRVGDQVVEGQALAVRSLFETPVVVPSPVTGRVALISTHLGFAYIREVPPAVDQPVVLGVSGLLQEPPAECSRWVRVRTGDRLCRGQVVATRSWGIWKRHLTSPVSGVVTDVSPDGDRLVIEPLPHQAEVQALLHGRVVEAEPGRQVRVEGDGWRVEGTFGVGGPVWGRLLDRTGWDPEPVEKTGMEHPADDAELNGAAVLLGAAPTAECLRRLHRAGARAVIAPRIDQGELVAFLGRELRLGITGGTSQSDLALVVLEGFADRDEGAGAPRRPGAHCLGELRAHAGRLVYVDGRTQVRAGARRPEVIVSAAESPPPAPVLRASTPAGPRAYGQPANRPAPAPKPAPLEAAPPGGLLARGELPPALPGKEQVPGLGGPWIYPVCRPLSAQAYLGRFPSGRAPRVEAYPGEGVRRDFPDLPVLEGPLAERLAEAAEEVALALGGVLWDLGHRRAPEEREFLGDLGAVLLLGGALPRSLRRAEQQAGLWVRRRPAERTCPGFYLTHESPATVLRLIPAAHEAGLLVLLGRASGWNPWQVSLLSRSDVGLVVETLDERARVKRVGEGIRFLKGFHLVRSYFDSYEAQLTVPVAVPDTQFRQRHLAGLHAAADELAAETSRHWETIVRAVEPDHDQGTERFGFGDLMEAFYACLADALIIEGQRSGLFAEPFFPPPADEVYARFGYPEHIKLKIEHG